MAKNKRTESSSVAIYYELWTLIRIGLGIQIIAHCVENWAESLHTRFECIVDFILLVRKDKSLFLLCKGKHDKESADFKRKY